MDNSLDLQHPLNLNDRQELFSQNSFSGTIDSSNSSYQSGLDSGSDREILDKWMNVEAIDYTDSNQTALTSNNSTTTTIASFVPAPSSNSVATGEIESSTNSTATALVQSSVVLNDFNGDGRSDILWRNSLSGDTYIWNMNGTAISAQGYVRQVDVSSGWQIQGTGDFNGDGRSDVLWQNTNSGQTYIWTMNGNTIAAEGYVRQLDISSGWQIQGTGDFNGDGRSDIFWRNTKSGETYVWNMNGTTIASEGYVQSVGTSSAWQVQSVGDFNGDGRSDVLWRNSSSSETYVWLMNGTTIASQGNIQSIGANSGWQVQGTGDFNGDGRSDVLWYNPSSGQTTIWKMNGIAIDSQDPSQSVGAESGWQVQSIGDFNSDGRSDVLWRNTNSGATYVWTMNGSTISQQGYSQTVNSNSGWQAKSQKFQQPDINIQLFYQSTDFTSEQQRALGVAKANWERVITNDKDSSGDLKLLFTKAYSAVDGTSFANTNTLALANEIDSTVNYRTNSSSTTVDINGGDYDNRINWNAYKIDTQSFADLVAIAMHEIGHVLGLYHETSNQSSLMYTSYPNGKTLTTQTFDELERLGYKVNRNASIYFA
jgi:predicted Zn-dependent protease